MVCICYINYLMTNLHERFCGRRQFKINGDSVLFGTVTLFLRVEPVQKKKKKSFEKIEPV